LVKVASRMFFRIGNVKIICVGLVLLVAKATAKLGGPPAHWQRRLSRWHLHQQVHLPYERMVRVGRKGEDFDVQSDNHLLWASLNLAALSHSSIKSGGAGTTITAEAVLLEVINATFRKNAARLDEDPLWEELALFVKDTQYVGNPDIREWIDLCKKKQYDNYTAKSCTAPDSGELKLFNGSSPDAWYCGDKKATDWKGTGPFADLCHAERGSAYKPSGVCGSHSYKQLLFNYLHLGPVQWGTDARSLNVPSIDCILGIVDCDIMYCQNCPRTCRGGSRA